MQDHVLLVTGGASGIGLAVVEAALAEGWRIAIMDLPGPGLEAARNRFDAAAVRCTGIDVSDEAAVVAEIAAIEGEFGPLRGAVNSAGIGRDTAVLATTAEQFRRILDINVVGSFVVAREAARAMRGRDGAIVNISSVSGMKGNEGRAAYGASKAAVITMSQVMAVEFATLGVRVNVVAPGPIETPMVRENHTAEAREGWMQVVPMRRYGTPEEIASATLFLIDGSKSGFITGQTLSVDGGFTVAGLASGTSLAVNSEGFDHTRSH
ncbi:MAG: SDR family NAD(P)-dependent oxidoreductase [Rhizobiaceae bacterium]